MYLGNSLGTIGGRKGLLMLEMWTIIRIIGWNGILSRQRGPYADARRVLLGGVPDLYALVLYREWTGFVVAGASFGDGGSVSLPWPWLPHIVLGSGSAASAQRWSAPISI